jgi:uncharacterized protein YbjT (DUF2867 family)
VWRKVSGLCSSVQLGQSKLVKVGILGGSGLVGSHWAGQFPEAYCLLRRPSSVWPKAEIADSGHWPERIRQNPRDLWLCSIGSTLKKAGSKESFRRVDLDLVVECARAAKESGTRVWGLVSASGARPDSPIFYNQIKGRCEQELRALDFERLVIARPSLLLGDRLESRVLEDLGKKFFSIIPWNLLPFARNIRPVRAEFVAENLGKFAANALKSSERVLILESGALQK